MEMKVFPTEMGLFCSACSDVCKLNVENYNYFWNALKCHKCMGDMRKYGD